MTSPPYVLELATELVSIPSVNPMGREIPIEIAGEGRVTDWLESFFAKLNLPLRRYTVREDACAGQTIRRENILARLEGKPSLADGGKLVMLEAHQDTVPIDGMTIEPFAAASEHGRLTGRGACDIKGGMASLLAAIASLVDSDQTRPTIVMACTVNEEFGFCGAKHLTALMEAGGDDILPRTPDAIIVTEPTELNVVSCHKGMVRWVCETTGVAAHSSDPSAGENAIYRMAPTIAAIESLAKQLADRPADPMMGRPTLSLGTIQGGISVNTVPDSCRIEIDRRLLPDEDPLSAREAVIAATHSNQTNQINAVDSIIHHPISIASPGLTAANNSGLASRLADYASIHQPGRQVIGVPYGTDAAFLATCGAPTVVFGPGSIRQAHTKDEWVEVAQLELATRVLVDFLSAF